MISKEFLSEYKKQVAAFLRVKEANLSRGKLDRLSALEKASDDQLLIKWSFISAVFGSIASFIVFPLLIGIVRYFLPHVLVTFLWSLDKVMMSLTFLMFGIGLYLLFFKNSNNS